MEFFQEYRKSIITIIVLIVLSLLVTSINSLFHSGNDYKYIDNKDYVYTMQQKNNSELPFINIDSEQILAINDQLKEDYYEIILYDDSYINYEYNIRNDYLSIVIEKGIKKEDDDFLEIEYIAYNISIKEKRLLTNSEVLNMYNLDSNQVNNLIDTSLHQQYDYEIDNGYIPPEECNYTCYLEEKNYLSISENLQIYVDSDNKVKGYLNVARGSLYYIPLDVPEINTIFSLK